MRKLLAVLIFLCATAAAQTNWERLQAAAPRIAQSSPSSLASAARETEDAVRQLRQEPTAAARDRLVALDRRNLALFAEIGVKLERAGLADKVALWREFVTHYRANMRAARAGTLGVSNHEGGAAFQGVSTAGPGRRTTTDSRRPESPRATTIDSPPGPADVAASSVVLITPQIMAKATELGNSAARIYDFVHNNYELEPYFGAKQNSQAVFWSGTGNDVDQSTLLIALFRAANIPARYERWQAKLSDSRVMSWLAVPALSDVSNILPMMGTTIEDLPGNWYFDHTLVKAYVNNGSGPQWMVFDPSLKMHLPSQAPVLPLPAFNRLSFLSAVQPQLASQTYLASVQAEAALLYPGAPLSNFAYGGPIVPSVTTALPAATSLTQIKVYFQETELAPTEHHTATISLFANAADSAPAVQLAISIPETCLQSITIGWGGATGNDQAVMDLFDGLPNTPAALVNLAPQILIDGSLAATGAASIPAYQAVTLKVAIVDPYATGVSTSTAVHSLFNAGNEAAVGLASRVSNQYLDQRIENYLSMPLVPSTTAPGPATREFLEIAALRYFQSMENEVRLVGSPLQLRLQSNGFSEGLSQATLDAQWLFDRPFLVTPGTLGIDVQSDGAAGTYDLNQRSSSTLTPVNQALAVTLSSLECQVWEDMALMQGICTTKALQLGSVAGDPIYTITQSNSAQFLPKLQLTQPSFVTNSMQADLANGNTITTALQPIAFGTWSSSGWISEGPNSYTYFIYSVISGNGGGAGGVPAQPFPTQTDNGDQGNQDQTGRPCVGPPVTLSNGNMFHSFEDLRFPGQGLPIALTRTYNSQLPHDGPFGFGWTHSYAMSLNISSSAVIYTDGTGAQFTFVPGNNGSYVSPPSVDDTLSQGGFGLVLRKKDGTQYQFSGNGQLTGIVDRNGNQITVNSGIAGVASLQDAAGHSLQFTYNAAHRIVAIGDSAGRTLSYSYDANGNLIDSAGATGAHTTYTYSQAQGLAHSMLSMTDPQGGTTSWEYYDNDTVSAVIFPGQGRLSFLYSAMHDYTLVSDERGVATTYYFDSFGDIIRTTDAAGNAVEQTWSGDAKMLSRTDQEGYTTRYTYDGSGNITQVTDPLGNTTKFTYEPVFNRVVSVTDARGNITHAGYDANGNLLKIDDALSEEMDFTYDSFGNLVTAVDASGRKQTFSYDGSGNRIQSRDADGNITSFTYDAAQHLIGATNAAGGKRATQYDAQGRPALLTNELGFSAKLIYDGNGNFSSITDWNGNQSKFAYDPRQNPASLTDATGKARSFSYNQPGCSCSATSQQLAGVEDANGNAWNYQYDQFRRPIGRTDSLNNQWQLTRDARGQVIARTDAKGSVIHLAYDALGRTVQKVLADGSTSTYSYDAVGNPLTARNPNATMTFTYDAVNRLASTTDSRLTKPILLTYDLSGNRLTMTDQLGSVTRYTYTTRGQLASITNPKGDSISLTYDTLGRRASIARSNGVTTAYTYDAAGQVLSVTHSTTSHMLAQYTYSYDKNGNVTTIGDPLGTHHYTFDGLNRVTAATHPSEPSQAFTYDGAGNRVTANGQALTYDTANRLLHAATTRYTFDANGFATNRASSTVAGRRVADPRGRPYPEYLTTYIWDSEGKLIEAESSGGSRKAFYQYDAYGRRIRKSVGSAVTQYLYDGDNLLFELDSAGNVIARFTQSLGVDSPFLMESGGQSYFYLTDALGSVVQLTDASGATVQTYTYGTFGSILSQTGSLPNPYTFTGREFDAESGLYYFRARYYDPTIGRFLSPDPLGSDAQSQYAYAGNNPLNRVDPYGLDWSTVTNIGTFLGGVGAVFVGGAILEGAATVGATVGGLVVLGVGITSAVFASVNLLSQAFGGSTQIPTSLTQVLATNSSPAAPSTASAVNTVFDLVLFVFAPNNALSNIGNATGLPALATAVWNALAPTLSDGLPPLTVDQLNTLLYGQTNACQQ